MTISRETGTTPERKPGRAFYLLALLPPICGIVALIFVVTTRLPMLDDGLKQIVVPGARELVLQPGDHTVFLETHSVVDGRAYSTDGVPGLSVHVEAADGTPVAMRTSFGNASYSMGSRQGQSINVFRIDQAGTYKVSADYDGADGPKTVIAVGQGFMAGIFISVLMAIGSLFLGMILGAAILVTVFLLRRRVRRVAAV